MSQVGDTCQYEFLGAGSLTESQAQYLHDQDMLDFDYPSVQTLRYEQIPSPSWEWGAEGTLCPVDSTGNPSDFGSLYTLMGGWSNGVYDAANDACLTPGNQDFVFFPITGNFASAYQQASLWYNDKPPADATHIVVFINRTGATLPWPVDGGGSAADLSVVDGDTVWGDVLDGPDYVRVQGGYTAVCLSGCAGSRLTNPAAASNEKLPVPDPGLAAPARAEPGLLRSPGSWPSL